MHRIFLTILLTLLSLVCFTQAEKKEFDYITKVIEEDENFDRYEEYYYSYGKEIGLDFTPLIDRFVPFNFTNPESGLAGIRFKKYNRTTAFRTAFGANIDIDNANDDDLFFYISIGYEKRKQIHKNWTYTKGWELFGFGDTRNSTETSGLSLSRFYGIEYNFNHKIFLSTEASLQLGNSSGDFGGGPRIKFSTPQALFFNIRF